MQVGTPRRVHWAYSNDFGWREQYKQNAFDLDMSQIPVINHKQSDETPTKEIEEHRKRIEEEAKKEEENVNPDDVHPVLWTIYNNGNRRSTNLVSILSGHRNGFLSYHKRLSR